MGQTTVWRMTIIFLTQLLILLVMLVPSPVWAQGSKGKTVATERPGDALYSPTKLQWAAVELQTYWGRNWTQEDRVDISYISTGDGTTIRCLLQYTPDVSAQEVKMDRDLAQLDFDKYVAKRGWSWLRLNFEEHTMPAPH